MMTKEDREEYLKKKLNEIRHDLFADFDDTGMLTMAIDYDYVSAFSHSKCEGSNEGVVDFRIHYNADGTDRFGKGEK